ncbi:hypothetical protein THRCLA_01363 [Thraustotheca clavata]|uniref:Transmembrane protein n=1 Tax=Thraustotheca clavata TaxID=74557 RepID=A0A1W0A8R1_9STRA|nr:hypothetical protein THRCLA_01363 [Thraustotheca clavata]
MTWRTLFTKQVRWLLSLLSAKYAVSDKSAKGDNSSNHATSVQVWYRITSNLVAGVLVALSLLALLLIVAQGVFHREVFQHFDQDNPMFWRSFGSSCMVDASGFVQNTCSIDEANTTATLAAWNAIGIHLGTFLQVPKGKQYPVSVCLQGASSAIQWATLDLVIGYDNYPACCPQNGSQPVAGHAHIESASRSGYPEGVYLFTGFADKILNATTIYTATDGSITTLLAGVTHTIITLDGSVLPDIDGPNWGMTSIILASPFGERYMITSFNIAQFYVITDTQAHKGWNTGVHSKLSVSVGWLCGHHVANYSEIVGMQIVFSLISIFLFCGDIYITWKGLEGVLRGKPVLTYDVLSGLERRKLLMLMITLNSMPSILYVDVARIYYGTDSGFKIWRIAVMSLSILAAFVVFLGVTLVQCIPSPRVIRYRPITFSAPVFLYASIISVNFAIRGEMLHLNVLFNAAPSGMGFWAYNRYWPDGIYTSGADPAINYLISKMWLPVILSLVGSIIYAKLKNIAEGHNAVVNIEWTTSNKFLVSCGIPRWITSMPLSPHHAIKIGNRMFCKPSTQVLFGYACVVRCTSARVLTETHNEHSDESEIDIISIYDLAWLIILDRLIPCRPRRCGINSGNKFNQENTHPRLLKNRLYKHTRGAAID